MKGKEQKSLFLSLVLNSKDALGIRVQIKDTTWGPLIKNVKGTFHKSLCSARNLVRYLLMGFCE